MNLVDVVCYVLAIVFFVLAAFPTATRPDIRFECLGFAALTLSLIV